MAKINVYMLASHRQKCVEIQSHFFKRIKNKDKIKVWFMTTGDDHGGCDPLYVKYAAELNAAGVETAINKTWGGENYMQKIRFAQTQDSEYSVKLDEDLWFNENVWDFMIENASILDDPQNLVLSPILSNGIPTCEMFLKDFMTPEQRAEIERSFCEVAFPHMWGVNYAPLNKATRYGGGVWDEELYYSLVAQIPHHYKGMHPVRITYPINKRINDIIMDNWDKLVSVPKESLRAEASTRPYLCNSVFMIRTDRWRTIVGDSSLYRDEYDEVPLNLYRERNGLKWQFIRNGYCFHMIYNTVCQTAYEHALIDQCLAKVRQSV